MTIGSSFPARRSSDAAKHPIGLGTHRARSKSESGHILTLMPAEQLKAYVKNAKDKLSGAKKTPAKEAASLRNAVLAVKIINTAAEVNKILANAKVLTAKEALSPKHYALLQSLANQKPSKISVLYGKINSLWSDFILPRLRAQ